MVAASACDVNAFVPHLEFIGKIARRAGDAPQGPTRLSVRIEFHPHGIRQQEVIERG